MEEWLVIPGFEGFYEASTLGRIRSVPRVVRASRGWRDVKQCILKQSPSTGGYPQVRLSCNGNCRMATVHRLIATTFLTPVPGKTQVNHRDGNKWNNGVINLEFCNQVENNRHALTQGLRVNPRGSRNGTAKLCEGQVAIILARLQSGEGLRPIANDFGVSKGLIHLISQRKVWRHVAPATSTKG